MATATPTTSAPDHLRAQLDGFRLEYFPVFFQNPEAIDRIPPRRQIHALAANQAHLYRVLEGLEDQIREAGGVPTSPVPELVELGKKSEELAAVGVDLTPRQLLHLAKERGLPVLSKGGRHIMAGPDWRALTLRIGQP